MYAVLNKNGAIAGYSVGDFYFTVDMARMFFDELDKATKIYGTEENGLLLSRTAGVVANMYRINSTRYVDFVHQCEQDGTKLHNLLFVPGRLKDCNVDRHNDIWKVDFCCLYKCMSGLDCLGYLQTDKELYSARSVLIVMIQAETPGLGYGTRIVTELKSRGIKLRGIATTEAARFWEKQGAVLREYNRFNI